MIRLVLDESGGLAVDLAGRAFGRGAWAHPRSDCLLRAARGGAQRGLKANVRIEGAALLSAVRSAADRRVEALLASARGAGKVVALFQAIGVSDVRNHMSAVLPEQVERAKRHLEKQGAEAVVEERLRHGVVKRRVKRAAAEASSPAAAPPPREPRVAAPVAPPV